MKPGFDRTKARLRHIPRWFAVSAMATQLAVLLTTSLPAGAATSVYEFQPSHPRTCRDTSALSQLTWTFKCVDSSGNGVPNCTFQLTSPQAIANSGGHLNHELNRPLLTLNPLSGITDSSGKLTGVT